MLTISVLASPGTPTSRQWPRVKMAAKICSITSFWPTMTFCSSSCISRRCWLNSCRTSPRLRGLVDTRRLHGRGSGWRAEGPPNSNGVTADQQRGAAEAAARRAEEAFGLQTRPVPGFLATPRRGKTGPVSAPERGHRGYLESGCRPKMVTGLAREQRRNERVAACEQLAPFSWPRLPPLRSHGPRAEVTADEVRRRHPGRSPLSEEPAAERERQLAGSRGYQGGVTALCTLALLECGEPREFARRRQGRRLPADARRAEIRLCHVAADDGLLRCRSKEEPAADPAQCRLALAGADQDGPRAGAWTYFAASDQTSIGDNSNSQFALLGLHEAEQAGVRVDDATWKRTLDYWLSCQRLDGSWGYYKPLPDQPKRPRRGSMTCAGIGAMVISCRTAVSEGDARVVDGAIQCCCERDDSDSITRRCSGWEPLQGE